MSGPDEKLLLLAKGNGSHPMFRRVFLIVVRSAEESAKSDRFLPVLKFVFHLTEQPEIAYDPIHRPQCFASVRL